MDLTNEDVADILALLDSLPYDELDLRTTRFRLTLRRTPDGWTQSTQVLGEGGGSGPWGPHGPSKGGGSGPWGPHGPSIGSGGPHGPINEVGAGTGSETAGSGGAGEVGEAGGAGDHGGRAGDHGGRAGDHGGRAGDHGGRAGDHGGRAGGEGGGAGGETVAEGEGAGGEGDEGLVAVRAPLPGTFYRAPRPGAAPFVEVGSRVGADTVVAIVETMKLMNSVPAGADGTVAEICLDNAEFAAQGATLMRIRADR
jgi:acetyl-CoA carboxylase biotin carboxyl carrier protein